MVVHNFSWPVRSKNCTILSLTYVKKIVRVRQFCCGYSKAAQTTKLRDLMKVSPERVKQGINTFLTKQLRGVTFCESSTLVCQFLPLGQFTGTSATKGVFLWYRSHRDWNLFCKFRMTFMRTQKTQRRDFPVVVKHELSSVPPVKTSCCTFVALWRGIAVGEIDSCCTML